MFSCLGLLGFRDISMKLCSQNKTSWDQNLIGLLKISHDNTRKAYKNVT